MEQIPSQEANRFSASQKIPHILWNPKVHYLIYKCLPPVPILSLINPVYVSTSHFLKIQLNIILSSNPGSSKWPLSLSFPHQSPVITHLSPIRATCPACFILLYLVTRTTFGEQYRSLIFSLCSFLHSPVTSSLWDPNIIFSTLFSNTLRLRSSLNVSDQVAHPYNTTGKITVLYIFIFTFWQATAR